MRFHLQSGRRERDTRAERMPRGERGEIETDRIDKCDGASYNLCKCGRTSSHLENVTRVYGGTVMGIDEIAVCWTTDHLRALQEGEKKDERA